MAETYTSRTLRELVRIIASRFSGMVLIFAAIVAVVTVTTFFAPKWYRSEVLLKAEPSSISNPLQEQASSLREQISLFVSTQREIIMSDYVLASALMKLEMPEYASNGTKWNEVSDKPWFSSEAVEEYISKASERLRRFRERVGVVTPGGPDATFTQTFKIRVDWPEDIRKEDPVELDALKDIKPDPAVLAANKAMYAEMSDKQRAAHDCFLLGKWIVKSYLTRYSEIKVKESGRATKFLETKSIVAAAEQLKIATTEFSAYSKALGPDMMTVVSITGDQGVDSGIAGTLFDIDSKVNTLNARLAELSALQKAIDTELARKKVQKIAVPDEVIKANPAIAVLQVEITKLKLQLNKLTPEYEGAYQDLEYLRKEIRAGYRDIHAQLIKQRERTAYTIAQLTSSRADLNKKKKSLEKQMTELGPKTVKYQYLKKQVAAATTNYEREQRQILESGRATDLARSPVLVSTMGDPTRPNPKDPRRPIVWMNILLACVAGLVLALVYAFMADHFDHTLKSIDDAERYLGSPVIGSVAKLGRNIIQTGSETRLGGKSEEIFRGMWASLFYSGRVTGKTVLLSSAARGEGVTTIACGLALSGSGPSGGAKVALVDFNLRNPSVHDKFNLPQGPGLTEVLVDGLEVASVARAVNDCLDVYTVGSIGKQSLNVLRSDAVKKFFGSLAEKYDYVLVDSAATNHYPDSQVLSGVLKEVVLVVHSDITPREAVSQAKKRIVAGGGKLGGVVMNMRTYPIPNFLYRRV